MFGHKAKTTMGSTAATLLPTPVDDRSTTLLPCFIAVAKARGILLKTEQLIQDNLVNSDNISIAELLPCARRVGLRAKVLKLRARDLVPLRKALPAIVRLRSGASMVLTWFDLKPAAPTLVLQDPNAGEDVALPLDLVRFEEAWTGEIILVERAYGFTDEEQPFSVRFIAGLVFRERTMVRDIAISSFILSLIALSPIVFWRLLTGKVIYYSSMSSFTVICLMMLFIVGCEAALFYFRQFVLQEILARVDARINEYVYDRLLRLPIDFFERMQVGSIIHDVFEINRIRTFMSGQLFGSLLDSTMLLFFVPLMFLFSPLMTAIVLALCGLMVVWLVVTLPVHRAATGRFVTAQVERGSFLYETLAGVRTVKSLALETRRREEWDRKIANVARRSQEFGHVSGLLQTVAHPLERLAVSGSLAVGIYVAATTRDPVNIGALFAFMMLAQRVSAPLTQMTQLVHTYDEARIAISMLANLVNRPKEEGSERHGVRKRLEGRVEFVNVSFKYPGAAKNALDDVTFEAPIGCTLGVVGRSGSGKTTVTRLLQRLHSDYSGLIKIDGVDLRQYNIEHLRRSLGVVLQDNFLFTGTIRENIAAAKPHAAFGEVVDACRLAGAEEFIERLPRGYETHIYEGSPNLSGGQRQRLAIARALIVDPRILILDEATSALDPDSEAIVNDNIRRIAAGRTVIVISHRLSSLAASDAILVLELGRYVDLGKHGELLERCEIYRSLWSQQNRHIAAATRASQGGPLRVS